MLSKYFNKESFIHSIKTTIAALIGLFITKVVGLPSHIWIVLTIYVVMCAQIYVGSVMIKSYFRFLGTILGCLFASFILFFVGDSIYAITVAVAVAGFIFSYIATQQEDMVYTGTLGAITTAVILLGQTPPTLSFALERFLEIAVGILIATLVSQFIFPIHARDHLQRAQIETLSQLRDLYIIFFVDRYKKSADEKTVDDKELDDQIAKSVIKQRQLAKQSKHDLLGETLDPIHFSGTLYCERELLRSIIFMYKALVSVKKADEIFATHPIAHRFNESIIDVLNTLITLFGSDDKTKGHIHVPELTPLKELVESLPAETQEERIHLDGFLFCAQILSNDLVNLAKLNQIKICNQKDMTSFA